jgi:hypothetical protein
MAFRDDQKTLSRSRYLRDRAEETRRVALQILDAFSRRTMLEIAESYDSLARHAARRLVEAGRLAPVTARAAPSERS